MTLSQGRRSILLLLGLLLACAVQAKTLRWASNADHSSADPHGQLQITNNAINGQVYERLVARGRKLEIVPSLAVSWERKSPTTWIFHLRKGVKWQDGTDFTAEDVVFSVKRARTPPSTFKVYAQAMGEPRKIDDYTVELTTQAPQPVMLETVDQVPIISKAWCEKHHVERAQDFAGKEETYASRNAMGTGPFMLVSREPDAKSVFRKNPNWWGIKEGLFEGNVDEIVYNVIKSDSTRLAGLASGDLDFIIDPPIQNIEALKRDPRIHVYAEPENLVFFLGMDQARDELLYSDVKGRNPFKDHRVRQALYQAIDEAAIDRVVMRGLSISTAVILPNPEAAGVPKDFIARYPYDVAAAKKLMMEAGYANGFTVSMDCQNVRDNICIAIAGMLAQINVRVKVNSLPNALFFAKGQKRDTSFYLIGWGGQNTDPIFILQPALHSHDAKGDGDYNWGDYKDADFDALIDEIRVELDPAKRQQEIFAALKMHNDKILNIPLHRRMAPWASRSNVHVQHLPSGWLEVRWVKID